MKEENIKSKKGKESHYDTLRPKVGLRSEEIDEILGAPPKAIIRYGITVIGAVIVAVIAGSAFIKYPDIIAVPIVITTQKPPENVVSRISGKPMAILVNDKALVKANQVIAIMQNSAKYKDMLLLKHGVASVAKDSLRTDALLKVRIPQALSLGEVQVAFNEFTKSREEMMLFLKQDYYTKKEKALEQQLTGYSEYRAKLAQQMGVTSQDYTLIRKQQKRDSLLLSQKVIAPADYEKTQSTMLLKRSNVIQQSILITNALIEEGKLKQSLAELRLEAQNKRQQQERALLSAFNQLKSALAQWEDRYLLKSHQEGIVSFLKVWSTIQEVRTGETLFTVVPVDAGKIVGIALVGKGYIGKVAEQQNVNIKLSGYPNQEFGTLKGKIEKISLAPGDSVFTASVSIPQDLITTYKRQVHLRGELAGVAEIRTAEISILARIWAPLKYIINQQKN